MTENKGKVVSVNGNLVSVRFEGNVSMNEICFVNVDNTKLKSEVIRIRGDIAQIQVYEMTGGIKCGDDVDFTGEMLSAQLGPGLLGQIYDGLQNPLPVLAEKAGWFLERGNYADGLNAEKKWEFTPTAKVGDTFRAGEYLGTVPEGPFTHKIFVPFYLLGNYTLKSIADKGEYTVNETVAVFFGYILLVPEEGSGPLNGDAPGFFFDHNNHLLSIIQQIASKRKMKKY